MKHANMHMDLQGNTKEKNLDLFVAILPSLSRRMVLMYLTLS